MSAPKNTRLLDAARRRPTDRRPVWLMRQAGRYLPEYRELRANYDFLELCKTPEAAATVSIQPYERFGVDGIVIFNDILVPCAAMGMDLRFLEGEGPRLGAPIRGAAEFKKLRVIDPKAAIPEVGETIETVRKRIDDAVPVLGFCGSPWTLACYMIEGGGSKQFEHAKAMLWTQPALMHELLGMLAEVLGAYLELQIDAGAGAVQIFDTWGGILGPDEWREFSLPYMRKILARIEGRNAARILYVKGGAPFLRDLLDSEAEVAGIDWVTDMAEASRAAGGRKALQGNLDPITLLAGPEATAKRTRDMLDAFGPCPGLIANLGHGLLPSTPVESVTAFVKTVQDYKL